MRRIIFGDKEYRHYLYETFGLDLLGRCGTDLTKSIGLDTHYFFEDLKYLDENNWWDEPWFKVVE